VTGPGDPVAGRLEPEYGLLGYEVRGGVTETPTVDSPSTPAARAEPAGKHSRVSRLLPARFRRVLRTFLDPMTYVHAFRLLHYYGYAHVQERRRLTMGKGSTIAPNVSLANAERITIGAGTKIGERASLWAGETSGCIAIGEHCRFGPEVFITASDYGVVPGEMIAYQERKERDVVIGDDVWLGVRVFVGAGVTIGDGCVVAAGSVVTRDLPPNSIAAGFPARVVRTRNEYA
jgi:acetyltransferase-like isoleucine patch superfamily enzyme